MKKSTFVAVMVGISLFLGFQSASAGDTYVNGYYRSDGTYVQGYHRTTPDNTVNNNYSTSGNVNPYTGASGTVPQNPSQGSGTYNLGNGAGSNQGLKLNDSGIKN